MQSMDQYALKRVVGGTVVKLEHFMHTFLNPIHTYTYLYSQWIVISHIHTCMYMYLHTCTRSTIGGMLHIHMYIHVHWHAHTHVHVHVQLHVYEHTYMCSRLDKG